MRGTVLQNCGFPCSFPLKPSKNRYPQKQDKPTTQVLGFQTGFYGNWKNRWLPKASLNQWDPSISSQKDTYGHGSNSLIGFPSKKGLGLYASRLIWKDGRKLTRPQFCGSTSFSDQKRKAVNHRLTDWSCGKKNNMPLCCRNYLEGSL